MCTVARIDNNDYNVSFTQGVGRLIEDSTNAYVFWMTRDPAKNLGAWAAYLKVRPINKTTLALGAEQDAAVNDVVGGEQPNDWASVAVVRLTSGVMVAAMGTNYLGVGNCVDAVESAANDYTTWGARASLDPTVAGRAIGGMSTDGVNCFAYTQDQNTADVYAWKRTAANTWAACTTALGGGKIYDSSGYSSTAPWYDIGAPTNTLSSMTNCYQLDANTAFLIAAGGINSTSKQRVSCLWTTDGWATTNETVIKDYSALADDITNTCLQVHVGADGRARAMWFENNASAGRYLPILAYSDNYGQAWTIVGTPTAISVTPSTFDPTYDGAFCLDPDDRAYLSFFDYSDASNIKHYLYKGGDALTGWSQIALCEHLEATITIANIAGATTGAMFVDANGNLVRVFNGVHPGAYNTVNYLMEEGVTDEPGGPPPLVEESPSGSDATNIVLRNRLSTRRGWSAHDWPFSCFALWPEGDYTTQRRLPTKIAGVSIIDPSVDDPSALPAIFKFDDPEHYGRERFMHEEDGTIVPRLDPFYAQAHTKAFALTDKFGVAIVRGVLVSYRRVGATLPVQIWIDGVLVQTSILPETGAQGGPEDVFSMKELFIPLTRLSNVGKVCQLRFEVEDLFPFWIEKVAIKKILKKVRGRNQS